MSKRAIAISLAVMLFIATFAFAGCQSDTASKPADNLDPSFNANKSTGKAPLEVRFTNDSSGDGVSWLWSFGDGSTSNEQNPMHSYRKDGSYDVSLKVSKGTDTKESTKPDYIVVGDDFSEVEAQGIKLRWKLAGDRVHFILSAPTTGWVALGIDPEPLEQMKGADFVIGNVVGGIVTIRDDFGASNFMHAPDTELGGKDTILNKYGHEIDGTTTISFELPLGNNEKTDKYLEVGKTYPIILAYGASDNMSEKHTVKTYSKIQL